MSILIKNASVMTVDGTVKISKDYSIFVDDSIIADIGPSDEISSSYPTADCVIDGKHKLVIPGLINSHVHMSQQLSRGIKPDKRSIDVPHNRWGARFLSTLTPEEDYLGNMIGFIEMVKTGTTCFGEAGVMHPEQQVKAMLEMGIRGAVGKRIWDRPELLRQSADEGAQEAERIIKTYNGMANGRVKGIASIIGSGECSDELYVKAKKVANSNSTILYAHAAIRPDTAAKGDTIKHLDSIGVLDENTTLIHVLHVDNTDVEILKERGTKVVHCPSSMMRVTRGTTVYGRYPEMFAAGIPMGLGTDGADVSDYKDIIRAMYVASTIYKDYRMDPSIMGAPEAFVSATIGGAKALGWDEEIGSLEKGKKADIAIINMHRPEWQPCLDVLNNLVYSATGDSVETVIIDGRIVMENRKLTTVDEEKIIDEVVEMTEGENWQGRYAWQLLESPPTNT
ncbi:MAG: amidohydrolase family protein [Nitrososphaerota archaeon]|nr:amidohydrolase family protein [Nitrososphaerota archaeon]